MAARVRDGGRHPRHAALPSPLAGEGGAKRRMRGFSPHTQRSSPIEPLTVPPPRGEPPSPARGEGAPSSRHACHPPDRPVAVLRHQQRSVLRHGDTDRPPPYLGIAHHESRDKILILAGRLAIL